MLLALHDVTHGGPGTYQCNICKKLFESDSKVDKLCLEVHKDISAVFPCKNCTLSFYTSTALQKHHRTDHQALKFYKCKECEFSAKTRDSFKLHVAKVHNKEDVLKCTECSFETTLNCRLKRHIDAVHKGTRQYQKCKLCNINFNSSTILAHRYEVHGDTNVKRYTCTKCEYVGYQPHSLQRHIRVVHENEEQYHCKDCNYKCKSYFTLQRHRVKEHGKNSLDTYRCSKCLFNHNSKTALNTHIARSHVNVPKYGCRFCDFSSARKWNMELHEKKMHLDPPMTCDKCEFTCKSQSGLKKHKCKGPK